MINGIMIYIKSDNMLYEYLKYHSYWYKKIYRNENVLRELISEMKEEYKLTTKDKIEDMSNKITMVRNLLEIFR